MIHIKQLKILVPFIVIGSMIEALAGILSNDGNGTRLYHPVCSYSNTVNLFLFCNKKQLKGKTNIFRNITLFPTYILLPCTMKYF